MKTINYLKILSLFLFFTIIIPNDKFNVYNGVLLVMSLINLFNVDFMGPLNSVYSAVVLFGLIFIFLKNKHLNILGYLFTVIWLIPKISIERLKESNLFLITLILYFISMLLVLKQVQKQMKNEK